MLVFFNVIGAILSFIAVLVVGKTAFSWRGPLRGSLILFVFGFGLIGFGFLWSLLAASKNSFDFHSAIFSLGIALLVWGAERVFTFTKSA